MDWFSAILTVVGLCLFETISSIDNAIINAEVLRTISQGQALVPDLGNRSGRFCRKRAFALAYCPGDEYGIGPFGALTATFSSDPSVQESIEKSAPMLMAGGGIFLVFLFFHWLFLEEKHFGLPSMEEFFLTKGVWFYAAVSVTLCLHPFRAADLDRQRAWRGGGAADDHRQHRTDKEVSLSEKRGNVFDPISGPHYACRCFWPAYSRVAFPLNHGSHRGLLLL